MPVLVLSPGQIPEKKSPEKNRKMEKSNIPSTEVILVEYHSDSPPLPPTDDFEDNARSMLALLPTKMGEAARLIPKQYFEMAPEELENYAFSSYPNQKPDLMWKQLRIALWEEYDYCQANSRPKLRFTKLYEGICSYTFFRIQIVNDPAKLAYMLSPPADYMRELRAMYEVGSMRMGEILNIPIHEKSNPKLMSVQHEIHKNIEMRLHGSIVQRIDERRLNLNVNAPATAKVEEAANAAASRMTMEQVETRLKELQAETHRLTTPSTLKVDLINKRTPATMDVNGESPRD